MSEQTTQTPPVEWTGEFDGDATKAGRRLAGAKLDAAAFKRLTSWQGRTSEHGRDAAMLVWGI